MSKALKALDKVMILKSDGSDWDTWTTRVELAAHSIGYQDLLTTPPLVGSTSDIDKDSDLLNAMIGKVSDGIF